MKKYYCPTCGEFKHRWQLKKVDDTRVAFYECRYCHNSNIYTTEDVMNKLINNTLHEQDFSARHGSWLQNHGSKENRCWRILKKEVLSKTNINTKLKIQGENN